jgi:hypothetical protein
MITLTFPANNFDRAAGFAFIYLDYKKQPQRAEGYLFLDESDGQIYIMKRAACIQATYTQEERDHIDRIYYGPEVVKDGDTVQVDDHLYTVKILGNYSDAGRLIAA